MPEITAICMTYRRPSALKNALACFAAQTHNPKRLLILDDAGLYRTDLDKIITVADGRPDGLTSFARVAVVSVGDRYPDLTSKWVAALHLAYGLFPDTKVFVRWDDDDVYLPGFLSCYARALEDGRLDLLNKFDYSIPIAWPDKLHVSDGHYVKRTGCYAYNYSSGEGVYDAVQGIPLDGPIDLKPHADAETVALIARR